MQKKNPHPRVPPSRIVSFYSVQKLYKLRASGIVTAKKEPSLYDGPKRFTFILKRLGIFTNLLHNWRMII